jgi:hypothetical protein
MKLIFSLICACLLTGTARAQSPVIVAINLGNPGLEVATNFGVFSFETGGLQYNESGWTTNGYFFNPTNTQLITLFQDLGVKSIRVGGNSGDDFIPTDPEIDAFFQFAEAANVKVVFALDLKTGTPAQDAAEAQYIWDNYATNLVCFAIGNEPEAYPASTSMTNFASYLAVWQTFASTVLAAAPGAVLGGPDNESGNISYAPDFCQAEQGNTNVLYLQYHYKPGGSANGQTTQQLIDGLLTTNWDASTYPLAFTQIGAMAQSYGFPYRFSEFNPYVAPSNNITGGEDQWFSSALYAVDLFNWWAEQGCLGVHFHTGPGTGFLSAFYYDQNNNLQAYPLCYGIEAFNVGGYGTVEPLTITNASGLNLTAYSVENGTNLYVTIVNREYGAGGRNASVTIAPHGILAGNVSAMFLVQSNSDVTATNGVTFGGASISGTNVWNGTWTPLGSLTNGQCVISVPAASAAVIRIQAAAFFIPPVIVTNLPSQVLLLPGETYQYSVGAQGGLPLDYQWYQGTTPVAGQTNTTYTVTAGSLGSQSSYFVIVTNIYGSVTSLVSTITVIAPATNSLAVTLEQFNPAGYWPMHEMAAAARGDIETNYGSLGLLGTGYYPDWTQAGGIKRQHTGPMAGDSDPDTAVNFTHSEISGSAVEFTNGLYVPHASPLTTLNPPFSVECWFCPTNVSTGVDIWSQAGNEGLNSGAEGSGVGYVNGIRLVWVNSGIVLYAFDNLFDPVLLPNLNPERIIGQNLANNLFPSNQWIYLVVTCDANNNLSLFTNGVQVSTSVSGVGRYAPDYWTPLSIGCGYGDERSIAGYLSEFVVYTNALQPGDIAYHYTTGTSADPQTNYFAVVKNDNPAIYFRMNSPAYSPPQANIWPELFNYGSAGTGGVYSPGTMPGILSGPASSTGIPYSEVTNDSALFSGVSSFADAGYAPAFNPTGSNANFTVTAMFKGYPCDGRVQTIVGHGANSWQLSIATNGCLVFNAGNGNQAIEGTSQAAGDLTTLGVYNDGNWHQVVVVNQTNVISIYVDGLLDTNGPPAGITPASVIPGNTADVIIGSDPSYTNNPTGVGRSFAGQICDVAFFTNALTAGQVEAIYLTASTLLPEMLTLTKAGAGQLQLNWNYGTLQTATNVTGPYLDITNASSPYVIVTTNSQQFYRVKANLGL